MSQIQPAEGNVFVATYGSLRLGMGNYGTNVRAGAVHVGTGKTVDNYDISPVGGGAFPRLSLKHSTGNVPAVVDVFESSMDGLTGPYDTLEGYPNFYNRTVVPIVMDNGDTLDAWIYHIDEPASEIVEDGDWCRWKAERTGRR